MRDEESGGRDVGRVPLLSAAPPASLGSAVASGVLSADDVSTVGVFVALARRSMVKRSV